MKEQYEVVLSHLQIVDEALGIEYRDKEPFPVSIEEAKNLSDYKIIKKNNTEYVSKQGVCDGEYRITHKDKSVAYTAYYSNNKLHGPSKYFFPTGALASITWYIHGKKQGKASFFFPDGSLKKTLCYKDDLADRKALYYARDLKVETSIDFIQGVLNGEVVLYYPSGELKRRIQVKNGKRHGEDSFWDESGTLVFSFEYDNESLLKTHVRDLVAFKYELPLA